MNLESQVVSLELANKLKELGVKQESLFYWKDKYTAIPDIYYNPSYGFKDKLSAFTVAELGGMLPESCFSWKQTTNKQGDIEWSACDSWPIYIKAFHADTEANSRALVLIHLIENNLVKVEDINK